MSSTGQWALPVPISTSMRCNDRERAARLDVEAQLLEAWAEIEVLRGISDLARDSSDEAPAGRVVEDFLADLH